MTRERTPEIKQFSYGLGEVFTRRVPYLLQALLIDTFDGDSDHTFIQFGPTQELTRQKIEHHKAWSWSKDKEIWIVNDQAQVGKTLAISIGGAGTSLSSGTVAGASATAAKQDTQITHLTSLNAKLANQGSLAGGQTTVGTSEVVLAASQAVPDGFAVVVKALKANTGKVYVLLTGVLTTTGFELSAGDSVALYVTNLNLIYAIATAASQKVCYIVEKAA